MSWPCGLGTVHSEWRLSVAPGGSAQQHCEDSRSCGRSGHLFRRMSWMVQARPSSREPLAISMLVSMSAPECVVFRIHR